MKLNWDKILDANVMHFVGQHNDTYVDDVCAVILYETGKVMGAWFCSSQYRFRLADKVLSQYGASGRFVSISTPTVLGKPALLAEFVHWHPEQKKNDEVPFEQQLFQWEDWDNLGSSVFGFYECTLRAQDFGIPIGTVIPAISIDFGRSRVEFSTGEKFFLKFVVEALND